jgi:hypothetical protein
VARKLEVFHQAIDEEPKLLIAYALDDKTDTVTIEKGEDWHKILVGPGVAVTWPGDEMRELLDLSDGVRFFLGLEYFFSTNPYYTTSRS